MKIMLSYKSEQIIGSGLEVTTTGRKVIVRRKPDNKKYREKQEV